MNFSIYPIVIIEPVSDQDVKLAIGLRKWNRDQFWTVDSNWPESSGRLLEQKCREVKVTSDLILYLKPVRPICSR